MINSLFKKMITLCCLVTSSAAFSFVTSCSKGDTPSPPPPPPPPPPVSDKIITNPLVTKSDAEITSDNEADVAFYGFEFVNLTKTINVNSTFELDGATITTSIIDFSWDTKTFGVNLHIENAFPVGETKGSFSFTSEEDIKYNPIDFSFSLFTPIRIINPEAREQTATLVNKSATITFNGFEPQNIKDKDLLTVKTTFKHENAIFTPSIVWPTANDDTFKIEVEVDDANKTIGPIIGHFVFYYNGKQIAQYEQCDFFITLNEERWVHSPADTNTVVMYDDKATSTSVTYKQFTFTGIYKQNEIKSVCWHFSGSTETVDGTIENFNPYSKTFDVTFLFDLKYLGTQQGDIVVTFNDDSTTQITGFQVDIVYVVANEHLSTSTYDDDGKSKTQLDGLKDTFKNKNYNALMVPSDISSIRDSAFANWFNPEGQGKQIKYLILDQAVRLEKIGKLAFENCSNLVGNLFLPESIVSIGDLAFDGCTNIGTTLRISNNTASTPQTFGKNIFQACKGIGVIDLTQYYYIPDWAQVEDNLMFYDMSEFGTILLQTDVFADDWMNYLSHNCGLPFDWNFKVQN